MNILNDLWKMAHRVIWLLYDPSTKELKKLEKKGISFSKIQELSKKLPSVRDKKKLKQFLSFARKYEVVRRKFVKEHFLDEEGSAESLELEELAKIIYEVKSRIDNYDK